MVSQIRFAPGDAAGVRFCVSPLWETVASGWALANPARHLVHRDWIQRVRDLPRHPLLLGFYGVRTWLPDFLTPAPAKPHVSLDEELAVVAQTPPGRVRAEILEIHAIKPFGPGALAVAQDPETNLPILLDALREWHELALAPDWPRISALLEADIAYRGRQLAEGGLELLLSRLHPDVAWTPEGLVLREIPGFPLDHDVAGRGFVLTPSIFVDRGPLWNVRADSPPAACYAARAVGTLWEQSCATDGSGLALVLGRTRAQLLALTRVPCTTTDLVGRTGLSAGAVSQHLGACWPRASPPVFGWLARCSTRSPRWARCCSTSTASPRRLRPSEWRLRPPERRLRLSAWPRGWAAVRPAATVRL